MIGQHDAAGADANRLGASGDVTNHNRRSGTGDAGHVVVFGEPIPVVAPGLGVLGEIEAVAQSVRSRRALRYGAKVQNRKWNHR